MLGQACGASADQVRWRSHLCRPFLDSETRKQYEFPLSQCCVDPPRSAPPRVSVRCSTSAALRLLEQLDAGDRLALLPERSIPVGRECGLFSVPKSALKDRMVLDARPANCFADPPEGLVKSFPEHRLLITINQLILGLEKSI